MRSKFICASAMLVILMLQVFCFASFAALDVQRWSNLGSTGHEFAFSVSEQSQIGNSDFLRLLHETADEYSVSILKSTSTFVGERQSLVVSGVYTWDSFPTDQLDLTSGEPPVRDEEFLASYGSGSPDQCGTVSSVGNFYPVRIQSMESYLEGENSSVQGSYLITSVSETDEAAIVEALSKGLGVDEELVSGTSNGSTHSAGSLVVSSMALLLVSLASFALSLVAYPLTNAHSVGVLKLMGWSGRSAWLEMMKAPLLLSGGLAVAAVFAQALLVDGARASYYLASVLLAVISLLLMTAVSLLALLAISKVSPIGLIARSSSFGVVRYSGLILKVAATASAAAIVCVVAPAFTRGAEMLSQRSSLRPYEDYYVLLGGVLTNSDLEALSTSTSTLARKYAGLYDLVNEPFGGLFVLDGSVDEIHRVTINVNCLNASHIVDESGNPIQVSEKEEGRIVLIPISKKADTERLIAREQDYLSGLYASDLGRFGVEGDPVLHYLYYKNEGSIPFLDSGSATLRASEDPVIHIMTGANATISEKSYLQNMDLDSPLKFDLTEGEAGALQETLDTSTDFGENKISVVTVKEAIATESSSQFASIVVVLLVVSVVLALGLAAGAVMSAALFAVKKREICVKRLLGWRTIDRYGVGPYCVLVVNLLAFAAICSQVSGLLPRLVAALFCSMDMALYLLTLSRYERKNLPLMLKGE